MKIALDATYSVGQNLTGVGVYSRAMLQGLAGSHRDTHFLWCYRPHRFLRALSDPMPATCARRLLTTSWAPRADIFHALNQRVDVSRSKHTVATFHDLFVISGDYSTPEFRARFTEQARNAAARSDLVITVSAFTARQVEEHLKVDPRRIRVIHHGAERPLVTTSVSGHEQLILNVGALQRRKNIVRLVEAFEQTPSDWGLALAGSSGFGAEEIVARIEASPRRQDIQLLGHVSDQTLTGLYHRASIFAFPSLDEGFGMPLLDAMACGVPILTSNVSALPEVAGDAALLVDPHHTESIASGLNQLIADPELRTQLAARGLARAKNFTWEKAVEKTWNVYQELVGSANS